MEINAWVVAGLIGGVVAAYLLIMRFFFRESRKADSEIDFSKVREWKDDEER